jgi:hypothetical protein
MFAVAQRTLTDGAGNAEISAQAVSITVVDKGRINLYEVA